jgi:hypothetical protein
VFRFCFCLSVLLATWTDTPTLQYIKTWCCTSLMQFPEHDPQANVFEQLTGNSPLDLQESLSSLQCLRSLCCVHQRGFKHSHDYLRPRAPR